eukprot:PhF_6_TR1034/c0_g1_i1/m.2100/K21053/ade; adenine deaminase
MKPYYRVVPVPNKGNGCLASSPIPKGTVITFDKPFLCTTPQEFESTVFPYNPTLYNTLCGANVHEKILWNVFSAHQGTKMALYPKISSFNHSCIPNCAMMVSQSHSAAAIVYTLRDVAPNEELCISYLGGGDVWPKKVRSGWLEKGHAFTCVCQTCSSSSDTDHDETWMSPEPIEPAIALKAEKLFWNYVGTQGTNNGLASVAPSELSALYKILKRAYPPNHWMVHNVRRLVEGGVDNVEHMEAMIRYFNYSDLVPAVCAIMPSPPKRFVELTEYLDLVRYIYEVPKIELHVHLEGTLESDMLFALATKNNITLPSLYTSPQAVTAAYQRLDTLDKFLDMYYLGAQVLVDEDDFYQLTWRYVQRLRDQNVMHVECFFDPQAHTSRGVPFATVVQGIHRALSDAATQFSITSKLIMCFVRDRPVEEAMETLHGAKEFLFRMIDGIGLDSNEFDHPPSEFATVFETARSVYGVKNVCGHGGHDAEPVPYISELVDVLHVNRIDHGVRVVEDEALMKRISHTPFTVCPVSNVRIGPYPTMKDHPLRIMKAAGLRVCVNSDDPAYLGEDLCGN